MCKFCIHCIVKEAIENHQAKKRLVEAGYGHPIDLRKERRKQRIRARFNKIKIVFSNARI